MRRSILPLLSLSFLALAALAAPACLDLQTLEEGVCGNGVVDRSVDANGLPTGEDCDGHEEGGFFCRPATVEWPCSFNCRDGKCPVGYGCGIDGVCRRPIPGFDTDAFVHGPSQAQELYSGDFDADGKMDILGVEPGRARIHFVGDTDVLQQVSVPSLARPSIGRLGGLTKPDETGQPIDTTDDLVLPLNIGIGALLSNGDRTFTPKTYGSITFGQIPLPTKPDKPGMPPDPTMELCTVVKAVPVAFDAIPGDNNAGDETGALLGVTLPNGKASSFGFFLSFSGGGGGVIFRLPDTPPDQLSGRPVVADFDKDKCKEIVFPRMAPEGATTTSTLEVYKPCLQSPKGYDWTHFGNGQDPVLAVIETGGYIVGPAFVHDVNGDKNEDLLITTVSTKKPGEVTHPQLRVAYSLGNGQFDSHDPNLGAVLGDNTASVLLTLDSSPLAVGDLNGDPWSDIVTGTQVLLGRQGKVSGEPLAFDSIYQSGRLWSEAFITNLNGDAFPDVVADAAGAPDIDVLTGKGDFLPNPSKVSTDGTVSNLTVGDFDGDQVTDLVFQNTLTAQSNLLMIAYGRTSGGPEDPRQIGDFDSIQAIEAGSVLALGADSITDLGVVGTLGTELSFSFFPGAGNRVMQTPYLLSVMGDMDPRENRVHIPLQTAMGFLRPWEGADEALNDVAIIALNPPDILPEDTPFDQAVKYRASFRLWGLFGAGEGKFEPLQTAHCKLPDGSFPIPSLRLATTVLVPDAPVGKAGPTWVTMPYVTLTGGLVIKSMVAQAHFDQSGACSVDQPLFTADGELLFRARTADLNGNGIPEILAIRSTFSPGYLAGLLQQTNGQGDGSYLGAETAELVVFWDGVLGNGETLAPYMLGEYPGAVNDFTIGDIDGDGKPEVIVVGDGPTATYVLGDDGQSLKAGPVINVNMSDPRAVLLADADGDGIRDMAVASGAQLQIFRGLSKAPVNKITESAKK